MRAFSRIACALGLWLGGVGCHDEPATPAAAAGSAAGGQPNAALEEALRQAREAARKELNPKGLPVYSGPVGSVRGVVTISGDEPPFVPEMAQKLPAGSCPRARELYERLYRQGPGRTLADVLVTVTEYQGFLPARGDSVRVEVKGCAFDARTLAMTYGQHFEVFNLDAQAYMPRLVGTPSYALRVAMPGGSPVPVFAPKPGQYLLIDHTREYVRSDVFVLSYPTFDVTGTDGAFEISGVPTGNVRVTAYAPALGKVVDRRVDVRAGVGAEVSFQIDFSESEFQERLRQARQAAAAAPPSAPVSPGAAPAVPGASAPAPAPLGGAGGTPATLH